MWILGGRGRSARRELVKWRVYLRGWCVRASVCSARWSVSVQVCVSAVRARVLCSYQLDVNTGCSLSFTGHVLPDGEFIRISETATIPQGTNPTANRTKTHFFPKQLRENKKTPLPNGFSTRLFSISVAFDL